jgi:hypothetical protein
MVVTSTDTALTAVISRLTDRDRYLCRMLADHDVLTSRQLCHMAFSGERRTRKRLAELAALHVIDRIRPHTPAGSRPMHCLLGVAGAHTVAADTAVAVAVLLRRRAAAHHLVRGQRLAHHVGANGIFTDLLAAARKPAPAGDLEVWWSARRCAAEWGTVVRPDGYGIWTSHGRRLPFLLEYDTGTEVLARLAAKLDGYAGLAAAAGYPTQILFHFPTAEREQHARQALTPAAHQLQLPIATAAAEYGAAGDAAGGGAAAASWLPLDGHRRCRLGELPPSAAGRVRR